MYSSKKVNL